MHRDDWFRPKWLWLRRLGAVALPGLVLMVIAFISKATVAGAIGALLMVPLIFWLALIPALHWKDRYIGGSSNIWGAFLVFETSSWTKLIYWFVHVLPDWRRSGGYADAP